MWDVTDLKNPQQIAQQAIPLPAGGGSGNSVDILRRLYCLHDRTAAAYLWNYVKNTDQIVTGVAATPRQ
jgi:hypothetical protein